MNFKEDVILNPKNQRDTFKSWMEKQTSSHNKPYSPGTINAYASAIANAPLKLKGLSEEIPLLFSITDFDVFEKIKNTIKLEINTI